MMCPQPFSLYIPAPGCLQPLISVPGPSLLRSRKGLCPSTLVGISESLLWAAFWVFVQRFVLDLAGLTYALISVHSLHPEGIFQFEFSKLIGSCHSLNSGCPVSLHLVRTLPSHEAPGHHGNLGATFKQCFHVLCWLKSWKWQSELLLS